MSRIPPPPRPRPVNGFGSTTEAVMHYTEQGMKPKEIAALTNTSTETVRGMIQRARTERRTTGVVGIPADRAAELKEIYRRTLQMLSVARNVDVELLHALFRGTHIKNHEPDQSPDGQKGAGGETGVSAASASNDDEERDAGCETDAATKSETEPVLSTEPPPLKPKTIRQGSVDELGGAKLVTLYDADSGVYLNMDGSGVTRDRQYIYRGTQQQARAMRDRSAVARSMVFKTFLLPQRART